MRSITRSVSYYFCLSLILTLVATGSVYGANIYVDGSWVGPHTGTEATPYKTIQDAVDAAGAGDTVLVAPGTYTETVTFDNKDITVSGKVPENKPIIDGGGVRRGLRFKNGDTATVQNFVVQNCNATGATWEEYSGAGFLATDSSPTFVNCEFKDNSATQGGGGTIYDGFLTLEGCTISGNRSYSNGGGIYGATSSGSLLTVTGSTIQNNVADDDSGNGTGGGVCLDSGDGTFAGCTVSDNRAESFGGGISHIGGTLDVQNSTISGNTATNDDGGGFATMGTAVHLTDNKISGNTAGGNGGGFFGHFLTPCTRFLRCYFTGNTAGLSGGGLWTGDWPTYDPPPGEEAVRGAVIGGGFSCNTAGGGGAWHLDDCPPFGDPGWIDCYNSTFAGNISDLGIPGVSLSNSKLGLKNVIHCDGLMGGCAFSGIAADDCILSGYPNPTALGTSFTDGGGNSAECPAFDCTCAPAAPTCPAENLIPADGHAACGSGDWYELVTGEGFTQDYFGEPIVPGEVPKGWAVCSESPPNGSPTVVDHYYSVPEDAYLHYIFPPGLLEGATDPEDNSLTAQLVDPPVNGYVEVDPDGSFEYTPDPDFFGDDPFTYKANDGTSDSNIATAYIEVIGKNDAPVLTNDEFNTPEDTPLIVATPGLCDNDTDPDCPGVPIHDATCGESITATCQDDPTHGTVTVNPDGSFNYEPEDNFFGTDTFTYTVNDGTAESDPATVTVTVDPVNDAPMLTPDAYSTPEDTTLIVVVPGVLDNDTEPDCPDVPIHDATCGDPITVIHQDGPTHGTLTLNPDGSFDYDPEENFCGNDTFTYKINDGTVDSVPETVTITVNPVNDEPVIDLPAPPPCNEGSTMTLDASGSHDPDEPYGGSIVKYEWDFNDDGFFDYTETESSNDGAFDGITDHTWPNQYSGPVVVRVTDDQGLASQDSVIVTVNNVSPTITPPANVMTNDCNPTIDVPIQVQDVGPNDEFDWGVAETQLEYRWGPVCGDIDGDGLDDYSCNWNSNIGRWHTTRSTYNNSYIFKRLSVADVTVPSVTTWIPLAGDYDSDGKVDLAAWSHYGDEWYALSSRDNYTSYHYNRMGDPTADPTWMPVPGDYDGDSKDDLALFNESTGDWFIVKSGDYTDPMYNNSVYGNHDVNVNVEDDFGGTDACTFPLTYLNSPPEIDINWLKNHKTSDGQDVSLGVFFRDCSPLDDHIVTVFWGDSTNSVIDPAIVPIVAPHQYPAQGTYNVTVEVEDNHGGKDTAETTITTNRPPVADAGGPYTGNEGFPIILDGSQSSDPDENDSIASWAWDMDGDGQYDDATGELPGYTWPDNGTPTVGLLVTDQYGMTDTDTAAVTVMNVPPYGAEICISDEDGNPIDPPVVSEGQQLQLTGACSDPGNDVFKGYITIDNTNECSILMPNSFPDVEDCPDSSCYKLLLPIWERVDGMKQVTPPSPDTIGVKFGDDSGAGNVPLGYIVVDDDGGQTELAFPLKVNNLPAQVDAGADQTANEGSKVDINATFDDPGWSDTHTAKIDWGDGTVSDGIVNETDGSGTVTGSHSYMNSGVRVVKVTVTDDDGGIGTDELTVNVNNVPPVVDAGGDQQATIGTPVQLNGTFTDAGALDTHTATIDWGDGTVDVGVVNEADGSGTVTGSHAYLEQGNFTVTLTVIDEDEAESVDTLKVTAEGIELLAASYEALDMLLTLEFSGPVASALTCFDWIDMEIDDSGNLDFGLSGDQCLTAVSGIPYEVDGVMRYPVEIDIHCAVPTTISLAIAAFVSCKADDIDVILQQGAFRTALGGLSLEADVPLMIAANGMNLGTQGDVNGDRDITAYDAALILRSVVEGRASLPIYPVASEICQQLAGWGQECDIIGYLGDTDGSGDISSFDASLILQFSAGMIGGFYGESCAPVDMAGRRIGRLMVNDCDDQRLEISIGLNDVRDVYSAALTMTYNPQIMTVTDVSGTPAISDWLAEHGTTAPGELRISLAGASLPVEDGSLLTVSFDVISADAVRQLNITDFELNGGRQRPVIQNLPRSFALLQNYPNPFNPETWIPYQLAEAADVTITIYSLAGKVMRRLELGNQMPGHYVDRTSAAYWDGRNTWGEQVSSDVYFYQLQAGRDSAVRKMIIVK